jgi:hypothetical protein
LVLLPPSPNCPWPSCPQHFMSPLSRMAQVWYLQQTPQRPFGPFRGQSVWMKVRWCSVGSTIAQLSVCRHIPSTSCLAVVKDGAGVVISSRHSNGRSARAEVNRCG